MPRVGMRYSRCTSLAAALGVHEFHVAQLASAAADFFDHGSLVFRGHVEVSSS